MMHAKFGYKLGSGRKIVVARVYTFDDVVVDEAIEALLERVPESSSERTIYAEGARIPPTAVVWPRTPAAQAHVLAGFRAVVLGA